MRLATLLWGLACGNREPESLPAARGRNQSGATEQQVNPKTKVWLDPEGGHEWPKRSKEIVVDAFGMLVSPPR